jgi:hypothetical protein
MIKKYALFMGLLFCASIAVADNSTYKSPFSLGTYPPAGATPYCLSGTPTIPAGYFVATVVNSSISPISLSDGTNTYIATVVGNAIGCFIKQ